MKTITIMFKKLYEYIHHHRNISFLFLLFLVTDNAFTQLGFFEEYWQPKTIVSPEGIDQPLPAGIPEIIVNVDIADTINKISPYVGGNNLTTFFGGKTYDKPDLMQHIRNLDLPILRFPGGTGSNSYFWDLNKPQWPSGFGGYLLQGTKQNTIKWGDEPGTDYLSLDNYYILRDTLKNAGINVVNYYYARYGLSENPVQQAAHYAANWIRKDNGRTKFWEIGNEVYGDWNPGYYIDTNLNKDGQPYEINGTLYAQHCLVFLDSMRAAAAEIGADIKIGAVLGFQQNRTAWDIPVLQIVGNKVDFYIIHRYYGQNKNGDYDQVFSSFDVFYEDKRHIDSMINQYCGTYVPLVKTEWNTNFAGRKQSVSCATGVHALLGYKGIINEGIGIELRWNLVWSYKDGDSHGLISNERDNPLIEGIPRYFPRAPFHYIYYFRKFLGDVSVRNTSKISDNIDVFSTSFQSGHIGLSIINKTPESKVIAVNLENFTYGDNFYWYSLTPENNQPFSPKVLVNGQTNPEYAAGGPINYHDIRPYKAPAENGIRIELPPFSASFVLVEGEKAPVLPQEGVTFTVYGNNEGELIPLENATIQIKELYYITNAQGNATVNLAEGYFAYSIHADGFVPKTGFVSLPGDNQKTDTLEFLKYNVKIQFTDKESMLPIENLEITLGNKSGVTTSEGECEFSDINFGYHDLIIDFNEYNENISLGIFSDTLFTFQLNRVKVEVHFLVLNEINQKPISNSMISFNNTEKYTSLDGEATFSAYPKTYTFSVQSDKYQNHEGSFDLRNDTTIHILLKPVKAEVKFRLYDNFTPVNKAVVTLNNENKETNALGLSTFFDLATGQSYDYSVSKPPYTLVQGTILLLADTLLDISMEVGTGINANKNRVSIIPNPVRHKVAITADFKIQEIHILDLTGAFIFQKANYDSFSEDLDLSNLKPGVYFLKVIGKGMSFISKIIVNMDF